MKVTNFSDAQHYLSAHIPNNPKAVFPGGAGIRRTKALLQLLDNPQEKLKVIHVAGTSGKSSTSYLLSLLLPCGNKRPGLFISPHLTTIRERIQVNNIFISENQFVKTLNEIIPFIERVEVSERGKPTYFEILSALAFYFFRKENVDYAVMETGIGGLRDATNVVSSHNKVCVITKIGMDHMEILGKKLVEIAQQKAGIITENTLVVTAEQERSVSSIIKNQAKMEGANLFTIKEGVNYKDTQEDQGKTIFSFDFLKTHLPRLSLGLLGKYQSENCSLALAVMTLLSSRDGFVIDEKMIREKLEGANFFGRLSRYKIGGKTVIVDGAHNEQKMGAFVKAVAQLYPKQKFNFLIAFKNTKDFLALLRYIIPLAKSITVTSFKIGEQDWFHESIKPEVITETLRELSFINFRVVAEPQKALTQLLNMKDKTDIIITGSFYLIGELYEKSSKIR